LRTFFNHFLDRVSRERVELQEDLANLSFDKPELKVGDFGCGAGFISWCLLLEIPHSEVVGIDKYTNIEIPSEWKSCNRWSVEDFFQSWSIETVRSNNSNIVDYVNSMPIEIQNNNLIRELHNTIAKSKRQPIVQKGDIVTGEEVFPNYEGFFDLIYCKRLLYPIFGGEYENKNSNDGIKSAICHIANTLKIGGWFCFVEVQTLQQSSDVDNILVEAGFGFENPQKFYRPYKTLEGVIDKHPYLIYHCRKNN
jgi:hypothetical protein